jgi:hypothetical protein
MEFKSDMTKEFGRINFDFLLMTHIMNINQQLAKLPHEMIDLNLSKPIGQTHDDIIVSYSDMVEHLAQLLKPYWDEKYIAVNSDATDFKSARAKFGYLMQLCDRKGFLYTKMKVRTSGEDD